MSQMMMSLWRVGARAKQVQNKQLQLLRPDIIPCIWHASQKSTERGLEEHELRRTRSFLSAQADDVRATRATGTCPPIVICFTCFGWEVIIRFPPHFQSPVWIWHSLARRRGDSEQVWADQEARSHVHFKTWCMYVAMFHPCAFIICEKLWVECFAFSGSLSGSLSDVFHTCLVCITQVLPGGGRCGRKQGKGNKGIKKNRLSNATVEILLLRLAHIA